MNVLGFAFSDPLRARYTEAMGAMGALLEELDAWGKPPPLPPVDLSKMKVE